MKYTDVCVGQMRIEDIQREIKHYLDSCKKPSKLWISIERQEDGKFYTKIYMKVEDFKKPVCGNGKVCEQCLDTLIDLFVY